MRSRSGFTLVEILVTGTILLLLATSAIPRLRSTVGAVHLRAAARSVAASLYAARSEAVRRGSHVALRFEGGGPWIATAYADGDGDGVSSSDIRAGVDVRLWSRSFAGLNAVVTFGIVESMAPTDPADPGRRLDNLDDPIRLGRSDMASFGPMGTSSPGSVYLRDGDRRLMVVRLFGRTGRIRTLTYDPAARVWK